MVPPAGVNFTALEIRLSTIERSFSGSASTVAALRVDRQAQALGLRGELVRRAPPRAPARSSETDFTSSEAAACSARW